MTVVVYSAPDTRGTIAEWFVKELEIPHEIRIVDYYKEKEHLQPWFLKLNPFHMLPTIQDDGFVLFESGAVLIYLQNKYAGPISEEELGLLSQWILFANATLGEAMTRSRDASEKLLTELDPVLEGVEYLVGGRFTAADVALASYILYLPMQHSEIKLSAWPNVHKYSSSMVARPACPYRHWVQPEDQQPAPTPSS